MILDRDDSRMDYSYRFKKFIPSGVTAIRLVLIPFFLLAFFYGLKFWSISIFILAVATDAIDGYLARKWDSTSNSGAYFDVTADFILIFAVFTAFIMDGVYPFWVLLILVFMFLQFILTSKTKIPVYDPLGKYYGSFLFAVIFITLTFSDNFINVLLLSLIVIFTIISIVSRLFSLSAGSDDGE
jgi:CDP-diacylglycerol---glycerol-3-phosphate 3-phosphatidyltransferase